MDNNFLEIGKIVNTHALRGAVKMVVWADSTDVVGAMWSYIAYSGVLLFAVGKTDRISKSIFGAH